MKRAVDLSDVQVIIRTPYAGQAPQIVENQVTYQPALDAVLRRPKITLLVALLVFVSALWPLSRLGGEFLPPLDEGDLLYMPSALPGLSAVKTSERP